ncbi:hypothetical protein [Flavobacterium sp. I3-2]|uniref:hypothetical protein n=1 Tax=Flavobacterium sp. I3-2 TaxID=2748319 RepID=UPI0015AE3886|nr:hypothetical protein [Flavobacterium sp. I3-2]
MKNYLQMVLFFLAFNANAQFIHLNSNEESENPVTIVFEDGSVKDGFVKNNKPKNKILRAVAMGSNSNAFSNPELIVDNILFKPSENETEYKEIDVMTISQVIFKNVENGFIIYDRTTMYDINAKTLKIDYDNPKKMFFQSNNLTGFKRYRIFMRATERGKTVMYTPYYFIKSPNKNEVVSINPWSMIIHNRVVNYFKYMGSDCQAFLDYLTLLEDKSSIEFKEFKKAKKEYKAAFKKMIKEEAKENKKNKISNQYLVQENSARYYEGIFEYMYQKYLEFNCKK